ncbi:MAG: hypothetical protein GXY10_04320 [Clostridiales bacterium]|jgi:GPH family glycoside/pentoside/hexuronide:cation symporter|nr:hypothetical protein [Clostridiales bacterium]
MGEFEDNIMDPLSTDNSTINVPIETEKKTFPEREEFGENPRPVERVSTLEKVSLSIKTIGFHLWGTLSSSFGNIFLLECFFTTNVLSGTVLDYATVLLIITIISSILGYVAQGISSAVVLKFKSKWGKYRPWGFFTLIPLTAYQVLSFVSPDWGFSGLFAFRLSVVIVGTIVTAFANQQDNIIHVISPNLKEKKALISLKSLVYYLGYGGVYGLTFIFGLFSKNKALMYLVIAIIGTAVSGIGSIMVHLFCKERIEFSKKPQKFTKSAFIGFKYRPYVISYVATWVKSLLSMTGPMIGYLATIVVGSDKTMLFAIPSAAGTVVGLILATLLSKKVDSHRMLIWAGFYCLLIAVLISIIGPFAGIWFYLTYFMFGFYFGFENLCFSHITAEVNDYIEWKTGERLEAVSALVPNYANSLLHLGRTLIIPYLLMWVGYVAASEGSDLLESNRANPNYEQTARWLLIFATVGIGIGAAIGSILFFFYGINKKTREQMYKDLDEIRKKRCQNNLLPDDPTCEVSDT